MELKLISAIVAHHRNPGELKPPKSEEESTFGIVKVISFLIVCLGLLIAFAEPREISQSDLANYPEVVRILQIIGGFVFLPGLIVFLWACFRLPRPRAKPGPSPPSVHEATTEPALQIPEAPQLDAPIPSITESTTRLMDDVPLTTQPQENPSHQT